MSINKLTTDCIDFEINENLEWLKELKQEVIDIIQVIQLEIEEALCKEDNVVHWLLNKEWFKHYKLLQDVESAILRTEYKIRKS